MAWTDATLLDVPIKAIHFNEIKTACDTMDTNTCWSHNAAYNGTLHATHLATHDATYKTTYYTTHQAAHHTAYKGTHYVTVRATHYFVYKTAHDSNYKFSDKYDI